MSELLTIDEVLEYYKDKVEKKIPLAPGEYIDNAIKMNFLISSLDEEICDLRASIADIAVLCLDEGKSATEAKIRANSGDLYRRYLRAQAKREQVEEFIRLSKLASRLKIEEMKGF